MFYIVWTNKNLYDTFSSKRNHIVREKQIERKQF